MGTQDDRHLPVGDAFFGGFLYLLRKRSGAYDPQPGRIRLFHGRDRTDETQFTVFLIGVETGRDLGIFRCEDFPAEVHRLFEESVVEIDDVLLGTVILPQMDLFETGIAAQGDHDLGLRVAETVDRLLDVADKEEIVVFEQRQQAPLAFARILKFIDHDLLIAFLQLFRDRAIVLCQDRVGIVLKVVKVQAFILRLDRVVVA